jgi:hypothetical protein
MSTTEQYGAAESQATRTAERITDLWTQAVRTLTYPMLPGLEPIALLPAAAASQATRTAVKITDFWTQAVRTLSYPTLPGLPQADVVPAVEQYFKFVHQTVDISRDLAIKWVEAGGMLSDAVREQAESAGGLVHEQAGKVEQAAREQAEKVEQAGKELARETRKAERDQARPASGTRA